MNKKRNIFFIINPISGTNSKKTLPGIIHETMDSSKWNVHTQYTEYPGHATALALEAIKQQYDTVVAIGGDGTINEVATALCDTDVALGIVPCGSGNGFARHLHLPLNTAAALQVINKGDSDYVDYCTVNDKVFFCTCGAGFDAQVSQKFSEAGSRGMVTYLKTTINEYFKYHGERFSITIDGNLIEEKAFVIACCNAAQYGNNAFIAPQASMQDGMIDVTIIHNFNLIDGALLGARMLTRLIEHDKHVSIYRGRDIIIKRSKPDIIHIDGDPQMMGTDLYISCKSRGLKVILNSETSHNL